MSSRTVRIVAACAAAGAFLGDPASARARAPETDSPRSVQDDTRLPVTVTLNPLAFAMQRYGANVEVSPAPHHALVGSAYLQSLPLWAVRSISGQDAITDQGAAARLGGEVGYRYYSGRRGADGLFVGASFVAMPLAYPRVATDFRTIELEHITATGAALDIGAQKIFGDGFTLGVGLGVMYLGYDVPEDNRRVLSAFEPHVFPRLLVAAGWSF